MHVSFVIYRQILDPHKHSHYFYLDKDQKLCYLDGHSVDIKPASLRVVQEKITELIKGPVFTSRLENINQKRNEMLFKNIEIINNKIDLHNERVKKSFLYRILHCFGFTFDLVEKISTANLEPVRDEVENNVAPTTPSARYFSE